MCINNEREGKNNTDIVKYIHMHMKRNARKRQQQRNMAIWNNSKNMNVSFDQSFAVEWGANTERERELRCVCIILRTSDGDDDEKHTHTHHSPDKIPTKYILSIHVDVAYSILNAVDLSE